MWNDAKYRHVFTFVSQSLDGFLKFGSEYVGPTVEPFFVSWPKGRNPDLLYGGIGIYQCQNILIECMAVPLEYRGFGNEANV